ncbi:hypothetical protein IE53DRAFT_131679 [Violaceomyces palustris]|uniref:Uncharacterized protein n=1 Tax=Violaceomyces palustris TaxID=1673888 RepID=A0ACD0NV12_9BASI|nr:hypothetical protein IE53DRAFT_131679 [Violaceomyces palustris]
MSTSPSSLTTHPSFPPPPQPTPSTLPPPPPPPSHPHPVEFQRRESFPISLFSPFLCHPFFHLPVGVSTFFQSQVVSQGFETLSFPLFVHRSLSPLHLALIDTSIPENLGIHSPLLQNVSLRNLPTFVSLLLPLSFRTGEPALSSYNQLLSWPDVAILPFPPLTSLPTFSKPVVSHPPPSPSSPKFHTLPSFLLLPSFHPCLCLDRPHPLAFSL